MGTHNSLGSCKKKKSNLIYLEWLLMLFPARPKVFYKTCSKTFRLSIRMLIPIQWCRHTYGCDTADSCHILLRVERLFLSTSCFSFKLLLKYLQKYSGLNTIQYFLVVVIALAPS